MATSRDGVCVVLVNWNGWRDTIECLESLFRSRDHPPFRVLVVDNASTDDSLEKVRAWAEGKHAVACGSGHPLAPLVVPPVAKPLPYVVLSQAEAEQASDDLGDLPRLILVAAKVNLGFAGGCNVGLRYAMRQATCGYMWLLNNDTLVDRDALGALVRRLQARPDAGQCGSRILSYRQPSVVQALGGESYNKWLASSRPIGAGKLANESVDVAAVERQMSYVAGAALCVTRAFVEDVGLLDESYFLYGEELDWLVRARGRFALAYAHDSIVYHKEGQTIGSNRDRAQRSAVSDYFMIRSRLRFTWMHARAAFPTVALGVLVAGINRIRRWQVDRALAVVRILLSRSTYTTGSRIPAESLPKRRPSLEH